MAFIAWRGIILNMTTENVESQAILGGIKLGPDQFDLVEAILEMPTPQMSFGQLWTSFRDQGLALHELHKMTESGLGTNDQSQAENQIWRQMVSHLDQSLENNGFTTWSPREFLSTLALGFRNVGRFV